MKTKVLIIEDNAYKSFTTKQILESQLRLSVQIVDVESCRELAEQTAELRPDVIMLCPKGGVMDIVDLMQKRKSNRRNTEVTVIVAPDLDADTARQLRHFVDAFRPRHAEVHAQLAAEAA